MKWQSLVDNTVGHNECEHKEAFMLGAHIMHTILTRQHDREIQSVQQMLEMYKSVGDKRLADLKTIASILDSVRGE